jgi:hypothetical protein
MECGDARRTPNIQNYVLRTENLITSRFQPLGTAV